MATKVLILGIGLSKFAIEIVPVRTPPSKGPDGCLFCTACASMCQEIKAQSGKNWRTGIVRRMADSRNAAGN